jgi:LysM repeat protein
MARLKRGALVASILMMMALILSACFKPYSQAPTVTDTPINPNSLFATPLGQPTSMTDLQNLATGTALAIQNGTPVADVVTATPMANTTAGVVEGSSVTPTAMIAIPTNAVTTATATLAVASTNQVAATSGVVNTSVPVGSRPATYPIHNGEFVYCLARRFDVDPAQILTLNGLSDGTTVYPGTVLKIPQSGSFPGARALRNHPATYTASAGETVYGVACAFGDVDSQSIAITNGISVDAALNAGQQLSIP